MKIKGLRWWVLALIVLVTIINYLDRNTLGIMWNRIVEDLGLIERTEGMSDADFNSLSKALFAKINMVFMIFYGLSQMFSGKIYDRIGTRRGFTISAIHTLGCVRCLDLAGHRRKIHNGFPCRPRTRSRRACSMPEHP